MSPGPACFASAQLAQPHSPGHRAGNDRETLTLNSHTTGWDQPGTAGGTNPIEKMDVATTRRLARTAHDNWQCAAPTSTCMRGDWCRNMQTAHGVFLTHGSEDLPACRPACGWPVHTLISPPAPTPEQTTLKTLVCQHFTVSVPLQQAKDHAGSFGLHCTATKQNSHCVVMEIEKVWKHVMVWVATHG